MILCKKCGSEKTVESDIVEGKQRFRCKKCGCIFRLSDKRTNQKIIAKSPCAFYGTHG